MTENYALGPFPTGSVKIRKFAANIKTDDISSTHKSILIRMEHYVNGAHIQLERIKKDIELTHQSSPSEDGWDIGLWCQMLDTHFLAVSVNMGADLARTLAYDLVSVNPNWNGIKSDYRIMDDEFLHPLRDALEHMGERLSGFERGKPVVPKPATFQLDMSENGLMFFIWGESKYNLNKMVDDLTAIFEKTIRILEQ